MTVKAVEVPRITVQELAQDQMASPTPIFQDGCLAVYPIPLHPSVDDMAPDDPSERPLKRKRSPSPPTSSKRSSLPASDHVIESASTSPATLSQRAKTNDFSPTTLTGQEAQDWRKLMLQEMFPLEAAPEQDTTLSKKEKRHARQAVVEATTSSKHAQSRTPISQDKKHARLPRLDIDDGSLPTLGYLLVGPSVRGRFDAAKAEQLGIPRGPLRARLTKGETVTFEVDDGSGGKIQRTVRPDECVGPSESPQVRCLRRDVDLCVLIITP